MIDSLRCGGIGIMLYVAENWSFGGVDYYMFREDLSCRTPLIPSQPLVTFNSPSIG